MRRRRIAGCGLVATAQPVAAFAHASESMIILTLPTGHYIAGAALTVAVTALLGARAQPLPRLDTVRVLERPVLLPATLTSCLSCLALGALVAVGFLGSRDPLGNLLPLTIWTLVWAGLTLAATVFGNVWRSLNPWTGPVRLMRRALGRRDRVGLARLGYLPAVAGFLGFAWFETVALAPDDPAVLARAVTIYWTAIFALAVLEGEDWLAQGEALTVFFGFIARIAPVWLEIRGARARLMAGPPGAQILRMDPAPPGAVAFVTLALAAITFDGLSGTHWWLAHAGVNPLEFPGRSAVTGVNTAGLLGTWAVTAATILGAIALTRRIGGGRGAFWPEAGRWTLSLLPIAAGYHAAHYLVALLTGGQYAIVALGDPLGLGWNPFGLPPHWVSFGFLSDRRAVLAIWNAQFAMILGAHLLAVILGLRIAARAEEAPRPAAHLPMTALMVGYTVLGLWLLAAPTGA